MIDLKYRDKDYLVQYDLDSELFDKFNLKVIDLIPIRKVYTLITTEGEKILKRIDYTLEEFEFIVEALKYVKPNYSKTIDFLCSKDGLPYVKWKGEIYCVTDYINGRECEFSNPVDLSIATKGLAELHKASEGFKYNKYNKNKCGTLISSMKRKKEEMLFFKNMANIYIKKRSFDTIFLNKVDYYLSKIEESIKVLENTQYLKLCSEEDKVVLCHHDLAHHNILIKNNEAYFIDFDYSIIDLRVHDLCNFINKVIKNFCYDMEKAKNIIEIYRRENSLNGTELEVLYGMFVFPEDFYGIAKDYYTRRKNWEENIFISRLNRKINAEGDRIKFLQQLNSNL